MRFNWLSGAGKASILLLDKTGEAQDRLKWKWIRGTATSLADYGTPLSTTTYAFCMYDTNGLVLGAIVPAGSAWQAGFQQRLLRHLNQLCTFPANAAHQALGDDHVHRRSHQG